MLVPGSGQIVRLFPSRIEFANHGCVDLEIEGPVVDFTVQQDLERGYIKVWGHAANGFFRYCLATTDNNQVLLTAEKVPGSHLTIKAAGWQMWQEGIASSAVALQAKQSVVFGDTGNAGQCFVPADLERLSLGIDKAQDWDKAVARLDLAELLPFWFRLGRLTPFNGTVKNSGTTALLSTEFPFENLLRVGFDGLLCPRLTDTDHQGFDLPVPVEGEDPLALLHAGAKLIRQLFLTQDGHAISVLPALPSELHRGRFLNMACSFGVLDIEWSKKLIRRMRLTCHESCQATFNFQNALKDYRFRQGSKDAGRTVQNGATVSLQAGKEYLFDHFHK